MVLVENVPGLLSSNGGRDFGVVVGTLADLGYGVGWRVLDSRFFGVPQRRRRVFIVGARSDGDPRAAAERAGQVLAVGSRCQGHSATRGEARPDVAVASLSGLGNGGPDDNDGQAGRLVAPALVKRYGKGTDSDATDAMVVAHALTSAGHDASEDGTGRGTPLVAAPLTRGSATGEGVNPPGRRQEDDVDLVAFHMTQDPIHGAEVPAIGRKSGGNGVSDGASVRRLTPTECERLQALPDGWTNPTGDAPDSRRYAALGDAVTASVAEWIGRRITEASA